MSQLKAKSETLCKAIKKLGLKKVEFAAVTGRSSLQIGRMCNAQVHVPDYIWAFLLLLQTVDKYAPAGWLRSHVERARKIQGI